jgi:hypothetical protein
MLSIVRKPYRQLVRFGKLLQLPLAEYADLFVQNLRRRWSPYSCPVSNLSPASSHSAYSASPPDD